MGENFCDVCQKSFASKVYLKKHQSTKKHLERLKNPVVKKRFSCDVCNYSTDVKCNLKSHLLSSKHKKTVEETQQKDYVCGLCDVSFRDALDFDRHSKSKKHFRLLDISLDMSENELKYLIRELTNYMTRGGKYELEQNPYLKERNIAKPKVLFFYSERDEKYLGWIKDVLSPISDRIFDVEGKCNIVWPNHRYIISTKDFARLIVSVFSEVVERKILQAEKETEMLNLERRCEVHKEAEPIYCTRCGPKVELELCGFDLQKHQKNTRERLRVILSECPSARKSATGYWEWWKREREFTKKVKELEGLDVEVLNPIKKGRRICTPQKMSELDFVEFLREECTFFSYTPLHPDRQIKTLAYLRKIRNMWSVSELGFFGCHMSEEEKKERQERTIFYSSLCWRINSVERNIFLSFFGFEKESRFSREVSGVVSKVWKFESQTE
ncbi:zinc finger protein [Tunisvirus fontaine2]|uniref:Zinc finger protein n=1 Tax=Tunisvirus fontaine2 TaxID=1421067 RepID=V9SGY9_9VIRU|nr:zinc finger protein [Tunisvirus fontaine2]AHC55179.1 zinc finger protein [Tunisvirus fontaine2]